MLAKKIESWGFSGFFRIFRIFRIFPDFPDFQDSFFDRWPGPGPALARKSQLDTTGPANIIAITQLDTNGPANITAITQI